MAAIMQRPIFRLMMTRCVCSRPKCGSFFAAPRRTWYYRRAAADYHTSVRSCGYPQISRRPHRTIFSTARCWRRCWRCNAGDVDGVDDPFACGECGVIQAVDDDYNYYDALGIAQSFSVDVAQLTRNFRLLQSRFHPDKFSGKSQHEQMLSAECSSFLNSAYQTLLHPMDRGQYLLGLENQRIEETDGLEMDVGFLAEIMETNEILSGAGGGDICAEELQSIATENQKIIKDMTEQLTHAFQVKNWDSARILLAKLKYYVNIEEKIKVIKLNQLQGSSNS